jgi:NTP pyrophosphatase (non-canonical NTP hydrolase)
VLFVDSNELNFVTRAEDLRAIQERINSALQEGTFQPALPELEVTPTLSERADRGRNLADFQRFHVELDKTKGFNTDVYFNYLCLSEEMGELGSELAKLWRQQESLVAQGNTAREALQLAVEDRRPDLESELADCMAYLLKMANYTGIDLEKAYLSKMAENEGRRWFG